MIHYHLHLSHGFFPNTELGNIQRAPICPKMLLMKYFLILTSPAPPAGPGIPPPGTENKTG